MIFLLVYLLISAVVTDVTRGRTGSLGLGLLIGAAWPVFLLGADTLPSLDREVGRAENDYGEN